jgi:hypothetical protein
MDTARSDGARTSRGPERRGCELQSRGTLARPAPTAPHAQGARSMVTSTFTSGRRQRRASTSPSGSPIALLPRGTPATNSAIPRSRVARRTFLLQQRFQTMLQRRTSASLGTNIRAEHGLLCSALIVIASATACSAADQSPPNDAASIDAAADATKLDAASDQAPGETDDDAADGALPDGPWCELKNGRCPSGCVQVYGDPYDDVRKCVLAPELVACHRDGDPIPSSWTCSIRNGPPARLYRFSGWAPAEPAVPGWTACSLDQSNVVGQPSVPRCE